MAEGVEGLNLLVRNLRKVSKDYPKEMKAINLKVMEPVATAAKGKVAVKSGRLRDSIRPSATQRAGRVQAGGGAKIPYAGVIHYGWPAHNIEGQLFLTKAVNEKKNKVYDEYESLTGKFIEKVWVDNF